MPDTPPDTLIYRLAGRADWARAREEGVYRGAEADARDGFIHFSTAAQLAETARRHYRGRTDAVLLAVPAAALGEALRWEASRGGDLFPHLYAGLRVSDVLWAKDAPPDEDGAPRTQDLL
jgi:uncharacterized protein (DUF952 family)